MAISAEVISRAIYDKPIQPLFNTIYTSSIKSGIPVIVTNTNNNLRVTATATVGSAPEGTELTDEMFQSKISTFKVDGFSLYGRQYFTNLKIDESISEIPNEFRTDAAGINDVTFAEILVAIGRKISEQLLSDFFTNLQSNIEALVPVGNLQFGMSGKIEWDSTIESPSGGKTSITQIFKDLAEMLPATMLPGGSASDIVTAWVSSRNFLTLSRSCRVAYQPNPNGGITSNYFQYVKEASTVGETRNMFVEEFIRAENFIIKAWSGLQDDTVILTYQEGLENARVFYEKVPANLLNNMYMVIRGMFTRNEEFIVPIKEAAQRLAFNLPYQVGNMFTINKVENAIASYKVIGRLASGPLFRESDKVFAYLPNAQATQPSISVNPDTLSFAAAGESKSITVTATGAWTAINKPDWITIDESNVTASANSGEARDGVIVLQLNDTPTAVAAITVSQLANG